MNATVKATDIEYGATVHQSAVCISFYRISQCDQISKLVLLWPFENIAAVSISMLAMEASMMNRKKLPDDECCTYGLFGELKMYIFNGLPMTI